MEQTGAKWNRMERECYFKTDRGARATAVRGGIVRINPVFAVGYMDTTGATLTAVQDALAE